MYPKYKEKPRSSYFPSVVAFAYIYFRGIGWRTFLCVCLSRRGRAELNKSAAICSLKIKFEANQHKSSSILHRL